jgi:hypothetical protein
MASEVEIMGVGCRAEEGKRWLLYGHARGEATNVGRRKHFRRSVWRIANLGFTIASNSGKPGGKRHAQRNEP